MQLQFKSSKFTFVTRGGRGGESLLHCLQYFTESCVFVLRWMKLKWSGKAFGMFKKKKKKNVPFKSQKTFLF